VIYLDDDGNRWLRCDCCVDPESYPEEPRDFYGIGLDTAQQVRRCAHSLFGWKRGRILVNLESLETRVVDMCPACQQPEYGVMRLLAVALDSRAKA